MMSGAGRVKWRLASSQNVSTQDLQRGSAIASSIV